MKHALIVYQDVPDRTRIYDFVVKDDGTMDKLRLCHNNLGNLCDNSEEVDAALAWLGDTLENTDVKLLYDSQLNSNMHGIVEPDSVDYVIVTGYFL